MQKMACIIQNKETFRKYPANDSIANFAVLIFIEQRNLNGFQSVSPQGRFFASRRVASKKSLNYEKRLREHKTIVNENQALLKRLQKKTSNFDVVKWHRKEAEREKLLQNLRKF